MHLTCLIRYQIDPFQRAAFQDYATNWGRIIPRCGGHLADYEAYRARLKTDPEAQQNFLLAQSKRLILREERTFLEGVAATLALAPH